MPPAPPASPYAEEDDVLVRPPRIRFSCGELVPGSWLRRYLPPQQGWSGETTQIFVVLAIHEGAVLLKEPGTGRELSRHRRHLAMSAYWELL
jgi:hypothetical protein